MAWSPPLLIAWVIWFKTRIFSLTRLLVIALLLLLFLTLLHLPLPEEGVEEPILLLLMMKFAGVPA
jgi:hypothetical protein